MNEAKTAIARHVIAHCLEGRTVEDHTPDDVHWSFTDWSIESYNELDSGVVEVHATQTSTQAEKVASRTHHHPAEYEHHDVLVLLTARADWTDDALGGECSATIDYEGGAPARHSPADPETLWRDI